MADDDVITPMKSVRDLGLDSGTTRHEGGNCVFLYHLRRLRQIRRSVGQQEAAQQLASAFFLSRDALTVYCNSVLAGHPVSLPLNRYSELRMLPVAFRII